MSATCVVTIPAMRIRKQLPVLLVALSLFIAACGGDDSGDDTTEAEATTTTEAAVETTTTAAAETTTTVAEATTTTAAEESGIVPGQDPEVDAIVEVYQVVFDSSTSFEDKAAFIDDPSGLEDTIATYQTTGESVGGVAAEPDEVTIDGENAQVVYTLYFSGNPTYPGQQGTAVLTDEGWQVTRDMFCGVMASARSACPAG